MNWNNVIESKDKLKNILILFGGQSSEHRVSCLSASSVIDHIDKEKYQIYTIGIKETGEWVYTEASSEEISDGSWENNEKNRQIIVKLNEKKGIAIVDDKNIIDIEIDCCFPILHGKNGEDGTIQGMMEILGIKYLGSRTMSSGICMDKAMTKMVISGNTDIYQARYYILKSDDFIRDPLGVLGDIENYFNGEFPRFVKPANGGSSIGISKVTNTDELFEKMKVAFTLDNKIVIEEAIVGREIEVAVLGNGQAYATVPGEILTDHQMYDYDSKYFSDRDMTRIVDDIDKDILNEFSRQAIEIYKVLDCRGLSRVDFFYSDDGKIIFNEINTMPGFTRHSMYPKLWENMGFSYEELIDKLIELGMEE